MQQVKLSELDFFADTKTKSTKSVLILPLNNSKINLASLILSCREQGLKAWILKSECRYGNRKEFDRVIGHFKEKPLVIAYGPWINLIQNSGRFDTALVIDPIVQVETINRDIREENQKKIEIVEKGLKKGEVKKGFESSELIPEFKTYKNLFLYLLKDSDKKGTELGFPGIVDNGGPFGSHPLGCREKFIVKILVSFAEYIKIKQP